MEGILQKLLELSMQAGCLILVVLGIRLVFRKIPRNVVCFLWILVGLRLMIPVSLESRFSLVPSFAGVEQLLWNAAADTEQEGLPGDVVNADAIAKNPGINAGIPGASGDNVIGEQQGNILSAGVNTGANAKTTGIRAVRSTGMIWILIWLFGSTLLLGYGAYSYIRIYGIVREAWHYEDNIWLCDKIEAPFLLGVIKPRIYIPCHIEETQLHYIVEHEKNHVARKDHISKLVGYALLAIYWFNPLAWVAYITFCKDVELACDERTIEQLGIEEKKAYSQTLLLCSMERKFAIANPLAFGEVNVSSRIKNVLNYKKPGSWVMVASILLCVIVAACFMTSPKEDADLGLEALSTDTAIAPEATLTALPMLSTVSVDLNGDGEHELVQVGITNWEEAYEDRENLQLYNRILYNSMKKPYIRINDMVYTSEYLAENCRMFMDNPDWLHYYIVDIDTNDGYKEIGLAFDGSGGASTEFIRYDEGELTYIGDCSNTPIEIRNVQNNTPEEYIDILSGVGGKDKFNVTIPGDGTITAFAYAWILETTYTEHLWKLYDGDTFRASIKEETRDVYEYSGWDQDRGEFTLTAVYDFQAYSQMDKDAAPVTILAGTRIAFYQYHTEESFIELKYGENLESTAWIIFKLDPVQDSTVTLPSGDCNGYELFHNLYQAG